MSRPVRIAFAGLMRSGKDTAADHLLSKFGGYRKKLADPLYDILHYAQEVAGFEHEKDRQFLQWIGTEWGRTRDKDVWVKSLLREIDRMDTVRPIFITDARFRNEFEALKAHGFILVKMTRPEHARMGDERPLTRWEKFLRFFGIKPKFAIHASERDVLTYEGFHYEIQNNNGPLEELYGKLDYIMEMEFPNEKPVV